MSTTADWPELRVEQWRDTYATLHMWTQIVGKIRLALAPPVNHWWHTTLYVTPHGLTSSAMPYGTRTFEIRFDFIDHRLHIITSSGERRALVLEARSVADFYHELMARLEELRLPVRIWPKPVEVMESIPFPEDEAHASYDAAMVERLRQNLVQADRVLQRFRSGYVGKSSPVHFFWGAFDLAVSRFSGRAAPEHPGGAPNVGRFVMIEGYSHELASFGWWPGGGAIDEPAFYAYAYPEPHGFDARALRTPGALYHGELREFMLPAGALARAPDADAAILDFCQDAYEAAADLGGWDREALERAPPA